MIQRQKIIRITTVPQSLRGLLRGQLRFMNEYYDVVGISSGGPLLDEVSKNEGIRVIPVEMSRTISPLKDIKAVYKLYKIFRREKPLIVHTHTPKAGIIGMLAAKLAGVQHRFHTVAGMPLLETKGNKRKLLNFIEKLTYACATKVYPNSFGLYDIILENKFASVEKLKVIGNGSSNGIDTEFFDPEIISQEQKLKLKSELGIAAGDLVFIFVGRIVKDKGIGELVTAFKRINSLYSNTKLLLVGNFDKVLDPIPEETLTEINANNSILAVGHQPDVRPYFGIADILTFPSYREGFPNVVLQASAMGLNCIVTNINGCNEIITDGENGLIIPVKDAETLFEKMLHLYLNPEKSLEMTKKSRNRIKANYERSFVCHQILDEYRSLTADIKH